MTRLAAGFVFLVLTIGCASSWEPKSFTFCEHRREPHEISNGVLEQYGAPGSWVSAPCEPSPEGRWLLTKFTEGFWWYATWERTASCCEQRIVQWRWK